MSASLKNHLPNIFQSMEAPKNYGLQCRHAGAREKTEVFRNAKDFSALLKRFVAIFLLGFAVFNASPAFSQVTVSYPLSLGLGWNLLGNSLNAPIAVRTVYGNNGLGDTRFLTAWKWIPTSSTWAFYAPSLDASGTLAAYCASKGYSVLTTINPGEGYWVNATQVTNLGMQSGQGYSLGVSTLSAGWNLLATANNVSPADFNRSLSGAPPNTFPNNVSTIWGWDNLTSSWYFYAPSLDQSGTLASYIASKSYESFGGLTLGQGLGFWANYTPPTTQYLTIGYTATPASYVDVFSNIVVPVTFTPSSPIPSGAIITNVHWVYGTYPSSPPSYFSAQLCTTSCYDITRYQNLVTPFFNGQSPNQNFVMNFSFQYQSSYPTSVRVSGYSLEVSYSYQSNATFASKLTGSSSLIAPAGVIVDPLAPPPAAGSH